MCLRFMFLLITRLMAWLRLARREEAWKVTEVLLLRHGVDRRGRGAVARRDPRAGRRPPQARGEGSLITIQHADFAEPG